MDVPERIDGYHVVEYGYFPRPLLPTGYVPPPDGLPPLRPIQNLAICTADGVEGYYLLFCTPTWKHVTYCFAETLEYVKRSPLVEFGQELAVWHKVG